MTLRAWMVFSGEPRDGCILVYAATRNEARRVGMTDGPYTWPFYVDVSARRAKAFDKYWEPTKGSVFTGPGTPYIIETNEELPGGAKPFYDDED